MGIDVAAVGELLIDFTPSGTSGQGQPLFEANPGGAPCNVLAMLSRLGRSAAFLGKAGDDAFGRMLKSTISSLGIDARGLLLDPDAGTTLAFVHLDKEGDRSFSFYRGADRLLCPKELNCQLLRQAKVFHFGTISSTDEPARSATRAALEIAENSGAVRSFDPNLRPSLWSSLEEAKEQAVYGLARCDLVKVSEEELEWLTGTADAQKGSALLFEQYGIKLIFVTLGAKGSLYRMGELTGFHPGFPAQTVDTTGAGDTFWGCVLHRVLQCGLSRLDQDYLNETLAFANAGAALVTERKGALKVMPSLEEIQERLRACSKTSETVKTQGGRDLFYLQKGPSHPLRG